MLAQKENEPLIVFKTQDGTTVTQLEATDGRIIKEIEPKRRVIITLLIINSITLINVNPTPA